MVDGGINMKSLNGSLPSDHKGLSVNTLRHVCVQSKQGTVTQAWLYHQWSLRSSWQMKHDHTNHPNKHRSFLWVVQSSGMFTGPYSKYMHAPTVSVASRRQLYCLSHAIGDYVPTSLSLHVLQITTTISNAEMTVTHANALVCPHS